MNYGSLSIIRSWADKTETEVAKMKIKHVTILLKRLKFFVIRPFFEIFSSLDYKTKPEASLRLFANSSKKHTKQIVYE